MRNLILAAIAALSLGVGAANAAVQNNQPAQQQGSAFNFLEGGGG